MIAKVDVNFRVTYYQGLVVVPAGGAAQSIDITVTAK